MSDPIQNELAEDLQHAVDEFDKAKNYVNDAYGQLTDEQINARPADGGWSVAECLEHLCVTAEHYFPMIDAALDKAEAAGLKKQPPYKYSWLVAWYEKQIGKVPPKVKVKTPKAFRPLEEFNADGIRLRFTEIQDRITERVHRANGYDLGKMKVPSPVTSLIKFPLGQAFRILAAHQRRHLWQADQVIGEHGLKKP